MFDNVNIPPTMMAGVKDMPMPYSAAPAYGYGYIAPARGNDFILIVVLFILLIIVGCNFPKY